MPTQEQMFACIWICQSLSNCLTTIEIFRYDNRGKYIYIMAANQLGQILQVVIYPNGRLRFIDDETRL